MCVYIIWNDDCISCEETIRSSEPEQHPCDVAKSRGKGFGSCEMKPKTIPKLGKAVERCAGCLKLDAEVKRKSNKKAMKEARTLRKLRELVEEKEAKTNED